MEEKAQLDFSELHCFIHITYLFSPYSMPSTMVSGMYMGIIKEATADKHRALPTRQALC